MPNGSNLQAVPTASPVSQPVASQEVTVLFGSQTGNSQRLAKVLSGKLEERGLQVTLSSMNNFKPNTIKKVRNLLIVKSVKVSKRLKSHPVCLSSEGELTIEMEKILKSMPDNQNVKADKVLEINASHEVFQKLKGAFEGDKEKLDLYTSLLYNQALLIEGLPIVDPVEFTNDICKVMV